MWNELNFVLYGLQDLLDTYASQDRNLGSKEVKDRNLKKIFYVYPLHYPQ